MCFEKNAILFQIDTPKNKNAMANKKVYFRRVAKGRFNKGNLMLPLSQS